MLSGRRAAQACALLMVGLALGASSAARAWTDTELESADAHVDVSASGRARIVLSLELHVRGGWLSRFEVTGLEPGATLDRDKPPWLRTEDGGKVVPNAELRADGTLVLDFPHAQAPRRGRHRLGVVYTAQLSSADGDSGARRLSWSLPAWRTDLADVDLWVSAPPHVRIAGGDDGALQGDEAPTQLTVSGRTTLHLHRVQLPRTVPFGVTLELPAGAAAAVRPVPVEEQRSELPRRPAPLWLGALVLALAALKRTAVRAHCTRRGGRPEPLVPLSSAARAVSMAALACAGALAYPTSPALGLLLLACVVLLALDRRIARAPASAAARSARARPRHPLYDLFGPASWLDATTPPGALLLAGAHTLGLLRVMIGGGLGAWLELMLLVTPLWFTATRLHRRPAPARTGVRVNAAEPPPHSTAEAPPWPPRGAAVSPSAGAARRVPDRAA